MKGVSVLSNIALKAAVKLNPNEKEYGHRPGNTLHVNTVGF